MVTLNVVEHPVPVVTYIIIAITSHSISSLSGLSLLILITQKNSL